MGVEVRVEVELGAELSRIVGFRLGQDSDMDSGSNPEARTRPRFTDGIGVGLGVVLGLEDRVGDGVGLDLGVGLDCERCHVESAVYSGSGLVRTWKH